MCARVMRKHTDAVLHKNNINRKHINPLMSRSPKMEWFEFLGYSIIHTGFLSKTIVNTKLLLFPNETGFKVDINGLIFSEEDDEFLFKKIKI